ncbi:MAG: D-glycero-beta-D-manno-heptose 1-phosphate adenylyltransferase [Bacteroidales bacterium]|nr:D-glycero-beta-D-manno-heptose 1-phosphate adenylyltransferase [Bacteroidales bacterium]
MIVSEIEKKIITQEQWFRPSGQRVVFTNGCFDILHRGHAVYLAQARDLGDLLVVGLNTDASVRRLKGPERPLNTQNDRAFLLASLACVDYVILFDEDTPENLIHTVRPDVLVKGGDYTLDNIVGADFVRSRGGIVTTISFVDGYSTTNLINKMSK